MKQENALQAGRLIRKIEKLDDGYYILKGLLEPGDEMSPYPLPKAHIDKLLLYYTSIIKDEVSEINIQIEGL